MKGRVSRSETDVENEGAREIEREKEGGERSGQGSKSRQWLKSLLPLSTSTRTSTRRNLSSWSEEKEISVLAFLYSPSLLSLSPSFSPSNFLTSSLLPATPPSVPQRRGKFISRSCLFWTFHNIWPRFGIPVPVVAGTGHQKIRL